MVNQEVDYAGTEFLFRLFSDGVRGGFELANNPLEEELFETVLETDVCERISGCDGFLDCLYTGCLDRTEAHKTCGYDGGQR